MKVRFARRPVAALAVLAVAGVGFEVTSGEPAVSEEKTCPQTDTGITLPKGLLRHGLRRQDRPRAADGRGARRHRVRQHVERRLLQQRHAARGRLPRRAQGHQGRRQGRPGRALRADVRRGRPRRHRHRTSTRTGLYAEINDRIVRYALKDGEITPTGEARTVLSGMPITGDHPMHPFIIDKDGNLFVSMGSATNTCEVKNRMPRSTGNDPCTELETRAGVWRYDANKTGSGVLAEGALRLGHPQRRGLRLRRRRAPVRHAARPRSAARELAQALHRASRASTFPPRR